MNIENKRQIAIILLAIGLGLVAAVLMGNHIQGSIQAETARLSQALDKQKVRPLKQEIGALRNEMKRLAGNQARLAAQKGKGHAPAAASGDSLALKTPAGKRAYTVRIDSLSAVGGLINPGDYVDLLAHMEIPDPVTEKDKTVSSLIFQNIQILAVGTNLQAPAAEEYKKQQEARALNVTIALTSEEAGLVSFIERNGKMQMILRAPAETENVMVQVSTWSTLADYVFEKQGTELVIPRERAILEPSTGDKPPEVKPFIEIFQGGNQL